MYQLCIGLIRPKQGKELDSFESEESSDLSYKKKKYKKKTKKDVMEMSEGVDDEEDEEEEEEEEKELMMQVEQKEYEGNLDILKKQVQFYEQQQQENVKQTLINLQQKELINNLNFQIQQQQMKMELLLKDQEIFEMQQQHQQKQQKNMEERYKQQELMQRQLLINQQEQQIKQLKDMKKSVKKTKPVEQKKKFKDILIKELPAAKPKTKGNNYYWDIIHYDPHDPHKVYPKESLDHIWGLTHRQTQNTCSDIRRTQKHSQSHKHPQQSHKQQQQQQSQQQSKQQSKQQQQQQIQELINNSPNKKSLLDKQSQLTKQKESQVEEVKANIKQQEVKLEELNKRDASMNISYIEGEKVLVMAHQQHKHLTEVDSSAKHVHPLLTQPQPSNKSLHTHKPIIQQNTSHKSNIQQEPSNKSIIQQEPSNKSIIKQEASNKSIIKQEASKQQSQKSVAIQSQKSQSKVLDKSLGSVKSKKSQNSIQQNEVKLHEMINNVDTSEMIYVDKNEEKVEDMSLSEQNVDMMDQSHQDIIQDIRDQEMSVVKSAQFKGFHNTSNLLSSNNKSIVIDNKQQDSILQTLQDNDNIQEKSVIKTEKSVAKTEKSVIKTEKSVIKTEKSAAKTEKSVAKTEKSVKKTEKSIHNTENNQEKQEEEHQENQEQEQMIYESEQEHEDEQEFIENNEIDERKKQFKRQKGYNTQQQNTGKSYMTTVKKSNYALKLQKSGASKLTTTKKGVKRKQTTKKDFREEDDEQESSVYSDDENMEGQKLDEQQVLEEQMKQLDRADQQYIEGSIKPMNNMYEIHLLEEDIHHEYKVRVKTQIYQDKRMLREELLRLRKEQQLAEQVDDQHQWDILEEQAKDIQLDPVFDLDSDETVNTEVTDEDKYDLLLIIPYYCRPYTELQQFTQQQINFQLKNKQIQTVFKRNVILDEQGEPLDQQLVLIFQGELTQGNKKVNQKVILSNLAVYMVNEFDYSDILQIQELKYIECLLINLDMNILSIKGQLNSKGEHDKGILLEGVHVRELVAAMTTQHYLNTAGHSLPIKFLSLPHLFTLNTSFHYHKALLTITNSIQQIYSTFITLQLKNHQKIIKQNQIIRQKNQKQAQKDQLALQKNPNHIPKPENPTTPIDLENMQICSQKPEMEKIICAQLIKKAYILDGEQSETVESYIFFSKFGLYFLNENGKDNLIIPYEYIERVNLVKEEEHFQLSYLDPQQRQPTLLITFPLPELIIKTIYNLSALSGLKQFTLQINDDQEHQ